MAGSANPFSEEPESFKARSAYMAIGVVVLFILVLTRLWFLQVIKGPEFRELSENNRTRLQDIHSPRGQILDRNGQLLVDNHASFDLAVIREDVPNIRLLTKRLSRLLNIPVQEITASFTAAKGLPSFKPVNLKMDLDRRQLVTLETYRFELPGIDIQIKPRRKYLYESLAAHVIGYLGEVTQRQLSQKKFENYRMGDLVGQFGLEKEFEPALNGTRGWRLVEVDAAGRVLNIIKQVPPVPGNNLYLTLDANLQDVAETALKGVAGAIVAMDPRTGQILAMASSPSFSQEDFVRGISSKKWEALTNNQLHPLENRAVSGQYMPGSTFKIVSAIAGLEEGLITPETKVYCTGSYRFGDRTFGCWKKGGHGEVRLYKALVESCDAYFYDLASKMNIDRLAKYSKTLGLGSRTGVGLENEKPGLVATTEWKRKKFNAPWMQGETLSVIIGQGVNLVTPLQLAQLVSAVVNGGYIYRPTLTLRIDSPKNKTVKTFPPRLVRKIDVSQKTLALVKKALVGVVNDPRGTGRRARLKNVIVGGKTGTVQVVSGDVTKNTGKEIPYKYRDNAMFVGFAPEKDTEIVVVVVAEHSGHGGSKAAPLAKQVLEAYFSTSGPTVTASRRMKPRDEFKEPKP